MSLLEPNCPVCLAPLVLSTDGEFNPWRCPAGHGLAATTSELDGVMQVDELEMLWATTRQAAGTSGSRHCPVCQRGMAPISLEFDADEISEGQPGDGPAIGVVLVDVCVDDRLVWFDNGELQMLPASLGGGRRAPSEEELELERKVISDFRDALQRIR